MTWDWTRIARGLALAAWGGFFIYVGRRLPARPQREVGANALLVSPILLALMVPAPSLGALAVKNKQTKHAPAPVAAPAEGDIRLYEVAWASESAAYAEVSDIATGMTVDFIGFVSAPAKDGKLTLSRFAVSCCAADATAYSVDVTGAPAFEVDTWVRVQGTLAGRPGHGLTVTAADVAEVAAPDNPYS